MVSIKHFFQNVMNDNIYLLNLLPLILLNEFKTDFHVHVLNRYHSQTVFTKQPNFTYHTCFSSIARTRDYLK